MILSLKSTVSQHLKELKSAGIIQGEVEGKSVRYCVNPETLKKLEDFVTQVFQKINR